MLGISRQRVYQLVATRSLVSLVCTNTVLISVRTVEARLALLEAERN